MNNIATVAIIALIAAISFIGGTFYGFAEGVRNFSLLEGVAMGSHSRFQLSALEKGKPEFVTTGFEMDIDAAIDRYSLYQTARRLGFASSPQPTNPIQRSPHL